MHFSSHSSSYSSLYVLHILLSIIFGDVLVIRSTSHAIEAMVAMVDAPFKGNKTWPHSSESGCDSISNALPYRSGICKMASGWLDIGR